MSIAIEHLSPLLLLLTGAAIGFSVGVITMALIIINRPDDEEEDEHERGI